MGDRSAEYLRGLADAAAIADLYATENFRMATDTVLTDPILSGRGRSSLNAKETSERLQVQGDRHAIMAHAAGNIAAAIREAVDG